MKSPLTRKIVLCVALAAAATLQGPTVSFAGNGLPREKGAVYLEDFLDQPYRLKVLQDAALSYNADQARFLGTLHRGQLVELQAVDEKHGLVRVRGQANQGQVAGWVEARVLTPLDPQFIVGLRRSAERRELIRALTASGEVALGMTMEEVGASLGAPVKKSSHADVQGLQEAWEYVRYESVPRQITSYDNRGRLFSSIVYVKVPVGKFSVAFGNGLVTAIDRSDVDRAVVSTASTSTALAPIKSVPPPVGLAFASSRL